MPLSRPIVPSIPDLSGDYRSDMGAISDWMRQVHETFTQGDIINQQIAEAFGLVAQAAGDIALLDQSITGPTVPEVTNIQTTLNQVVSLLQNLNPETTDG